MAATFSDQTLEAYKAEVEKIEPRFFEKNFDFKRKLKALLEQSGRREMPG